MLLSEIISKKIVNIYEAKIEGTVCDVLIKNDKIQYLKIFSQEDEEYLVDSKKIFSKDNDAIVIKNSTALVIPNVAQNAFITCPVGKKIYTYSGKFVGSIKDLCIDDKFCIEKYITTQNNYAANEVVIGEIAIKKDADNPISFFKPKIPKSIKANGQVHTLDAGKQSSPFYMQQDDLSNRLDETGDMGKQIDNNPILINNYVTDNEVKKELDKTPHNPPMIGEPAKKQSPQKIVGLGSGSFLVGRKITKTIFGINNEIVARKNATISKQTISSCSAHGKLIELALNSVER